MNPNYTFKVFDEYNAEGGTEGPPHGFRGESPSERRTPALPSALSIAVSRQSGARGGTLGKRVARQMGWEVYSQELLEYILREENVRREILDRLQPAAAAWVEDRLEYLQKEEGLSNDPGIVELARIILAIGVKGHVVFIGRGAGHLLPQISTLHVRVVAPAADRVGYMAQWLRMTQDEARELVRSRDEQRAEFLAKHFHHDESDLARYDLIVNSRLLGEEACADLIIQAARAKGLALTGSLADAEGS
ncbi:MAG: AAA family ATPase [Gemmataceae bacterium]